MRSGDLANQKPISLAEIKAKLDFFSRYPDFRLYTGKEVFRLREKVDAYLRQPFSFREEKQKAHGNLLWLLKNYYSTPFQQEAITLQNFNANILDLTDKDKLNYLNYILTMKNYARFSPQFFYQLSNYHPDTPAAAEQSCRVFHRVKALLAKNYKKDDNYQLAAKRLYPFLCRYAQNCPRISYKLIDDYADILFKMSGKFPNQLVSLMPLKELMERLAEQRRKQAEVKSLFGDEVEKEHKPQIDRKAVRNVLNRYIDYSLQEEQKGKFDANLHNTMTAMLRYIVEEYDYSLADIRGLRKDLGRGNFFSGQRERLYQMGLEAQRKYNHLHPGYRRKPKAADLYKTAMDYYWDH